MGTTRQTLKKKFGTPEKKAHLRVICATLGPGKAHLLELIADKHSITEAARQMKMSYKRAWQLIEALNAKNEPGRLTLYGRFGHDKIAGRLPGLLKATRSAGFSSASSVMARC